MANPRNKKPFATGSSASALVASRIHFSIKSAAFSDPFCWAATFRGGTPTSWGSVSLRWGSRPFPRITMTKRYSLTCRTSTSTPGIWTWSSLAITGPALSWDILPARRSVTFPFSSRVQRLPRAAISPAFTGRLIPAADKAPRPITNSRGSYPNSAKWAGPEPGVMP